jgi:hypothetical protein
METTQEISSYSCVYLKLAKRPCFPYYLLWFFLNKIGEHGGRTGSAKKCVGGRYGLYNAYTHTQRSIGHVSAKLHIFCAKCKNSLFLDKEI